MVPKIVICFFDNNFQWCKLFKNNKEAEKYFLDTCITINSGFNSNDIVLNEGQYSYLEYTILLINLEVVV
jgi:hypothetical protein